MAEWGEIQVGVPDVITDLAEIIDSFAQALLAVLNIALAILQVIKAFLIGFLDPLAAIVEAIINEIEGFLNDLRQIGLYVSGDLDVEYPFDNILGGYSGYERRMIARLVDRTDPTRPDFSSRSLVIAVFLYVSVDAEGIRSIIKLLEAILRFFGQRKELNQFTVPVGLEVAYGAEGATLGSFGSMFTALRTNQAVPNVANLRWRMAPPAAQPPVSWPLPKPDGFLIEVSTVRDGLLLAWDAPDKNAQLDDNGNQIRINGLITDPKGRPLRLFGGVDQVDFNGLNMATAAIGSGGNPKPGGTRVFAFKDANDNVPIPIEQLKEGDKYLLQRTFYVSTRTGSGNPLLTGPGQGFAYQLKAEDMPYNATFTLNNDGSIDVEPEDSPATTVFVRVAPVSAAIQSATDFQWQITEQIVTSSGQSSRPVVVDVSPGDATSKDRGEPSAPLTVTFPSSSTQQYIEAITAALVVMVLSRSDLNAVSDEVLEEAAALEDAVVSAQEAVTVAQIAVASAESVVAQNDTAFNHGVLEAAQRNLAAAEKDLSVAQTQLLNALPFAEDVGRQATGLEDVAKYLFPMVVGRNPAKYFKNTKVSPAEFRADLLRRCRAVANRIYQTSGNLGSLEAVVVSNAEILIDENNGFRWSDAHPDYPDTLILESLDPSGTAACTNDYGVALNPYAVGVSDGERKLLFPVTARHPGFRQSPEFQANALFDPLSNGVSGGSADLSPVVFNRSQELVSDLDYIRNVWFEFPEVYTAAAQVLAISAAPATLVRPPGEGAWIAYRLLPQGLPAIEQFLDDVLKFMRAIQAGLDSIIEVIKAYINLIEARILELQALINRINNLIQSLAAIQIPSASGLVVVTNGTDGVLAELVNSTNKPSDSASAYGAGVVILSGGLNASVASLLQAFFSSD